MGYDTRFVIRDSLFVTLNIVIELPYWFYNLNRK